MFQQSIMFVDGYYKKSPSIVLKEENQLAGMLNFNYGL
ncbi:unnamed protein product, partial [Cuscuta epithymum]